MCGAKNIFVTGTCFHCLSPQNYEKEKAYKLEAFGEAHCAQDLEFEPLVCFLTLSVPELSFCMLLVRVSARPHIASLSYVSVHSATMYLLKY